MVTGEVRRIRMEEGEEAAEIKEIERKKKEYLR